MTPASYSIIIPQRADFSLDVQFKDGTGTALNMTGYTVQSQIWTSSRSKLLATLTVTWIDIATGKFNISLPNSITSTINTSGSWDLLTISPNGKRDYWVRGKAVLSVGFTDER